MLLLYDWQTVVSSIADFAIDTQAASRRLIEIIIPEDEESETLQGPPDGGPLISMTSL